MLTLLDTEHADRNLTTLVTVLTHTPSASAAVLCRAVIALGDGAKDLHPEVGEWQMEITVGSQVLQPSPTVIERSIDARQLLITGAFLVPANTQVVIKLLSDKAEDSDVDVVATLYDAGETGDAAVAAAVGTLGTDLAAVAAEVHLAKAALVNKRVHTVATGVDVIKDDNGTSTLKTLTPAEASGVVTRTPS